MSQSSMDTEFASNPKQKYCDHIYEHLIGTSEYRCIECGKWKYKGENPMYEGLINEFGLLTVNDAIRLGKASAQLYPPSYYSISGFDPHTWVVHAICVAITSCTEL